MDGQQAGTQEPWMRSLLYKLGGRKFVLALGAAAAVAVSVGGGVFSLSSAGEVCSEGVGSLLPGGHPKRTNEEIKIEQANLRR